MTNLIWKTYKIGDLFERSTKLAFKKNIKDLELKSFKTNDNDIALISASRDGTGCVGYLDNSLVPNNIISRNKWHSMINEVMFAFKKKTL